MKPSHYYLLVSPLEAGGTSHFAFTYHYDTTVAVGSLVEIPFARRTCLGVVVAPSSPPSFTTKAITQVLDHQSLPKPLVELASWLAGYYAASPKSVWQTMLPAGLLVKRRSQPAATKATPEASPGKLTTAQYDVVDQIVNSAHATHLLRGVTGAGKTQVYIELARRTLQAGQSVIVLVPEIALTPQIVARFEGAFGAAVLHAHSRLRPAQRHAVWQQALTAKEPLVCIGPRSALFSPLAQVGLVVIDECHETSYKQEQAPRYWADAVAAKLVKLHGGKLVMGSATPSLHQVLLAQVGRIGLAEMPERANQITAATAEVIDLRDKQQLIPGQTLSRPLTTALQTTLDSGRQSLLFLNRRGSASALLCADCGYVATCPSCHLPLTFHGDEARLICHTCGNRQTPPAICPPPAGCGSHNSLRYIGSGTKRIEAEVRQLFPGARIARLDRDSATGTAIHDIYRGLRAGDIDILVGTQMIAKGLDLPNLDTVGVVSADTMLHLPDYTASERTFQLLSQVSGRTGRGDRAGRVLIQTFTPDHPAIQAAANGDWHNFVASELGERRLLAYPPFAYMLKLTVAAASAEAGQQKGAKLAALLRQHLPMVTILGPAPAFRERAGRYYRWQLIVKAASRPPLLQAAALAPSDWTVDIDPANLL